MQFPKNIFNNRMLFNMLIMTFLVAGSMTAAFGQRSVSDQKANFFAPPNLDQCANGKTGTPLLTCTGAQWQNGNLNENNSQWVEGQSVPYRVVFTDLVANTSNTITIEYDTTQGGKHAIDFLTTVDRTNPAEPCSGRPAACNNAVYSSFAIPLDPSIPGGIQIAGQEFRMYGGGAITSVSGYTLSGDYTGNSSTSITIMFNAGPTPDAVVLAWSGHISTRFDWGVENSAIALPGSPYHMRIVGTGNQDRSMSVAGIIFPASLTIEKQVSYVVNGQIATASSEIFTFSEVNFLPDTTFFTLMDDNDPDTNDPSNTISRNDIVAFGAENTITITEAPVAPWSVANLSCTISAGGALTVGSVSPAAPGATTNTATIVLEEGNIAYCTYLNTRADVTAALASVTGRVTTGTGVGISGARMTLVNAGTGQTVSAVTNPFGYYTFEGLEVEELYILSVGHKRYTFMDGQRVFTLDGDLVGIDFTSTW